MFDCKVEAINLVTVHTTIPAPSEEVLKHVMRVCAKDCADARLAVALKPDSLAPQFLVPAWAFRIWMHDDSEDRGNQ